VWSFHGCKVQWGAGCFKLETAWGPLASVRHIDTDRGLRLGALWGQIARCEPWV
jgi:hypothetical protein